MSRALLLAAALAAGCADGESVLRVTVEGALTGVAALDVTVVNNGQTADAVRFPCSPPASLPQTFGLRFDAARRGKVTVTVAAVDAANHPLATATDSADITPSHTTELTISLTGMPSDAATPADGGADSATPPKMLDFAAAQSYPVGMRPRKVATADFNGDGKLDIVTANSFSGDVSILLGNGDGTFQNAQIAAAGGLNPLAIAAADWNGDKQPDIIVADANANVVAIALGKGDGTFAAPATAPTGMTPFSVEVGDLNGDGMLDAVTANSNSGDFTAVLSPTMTANNVSSGTMPYCATIADVDGDGRADVVVANSGGNNISVHHGKGDGSFLPLMFLPAGMSPVWITAADLNGDGKKDLAVANLMSNDVSVMLQSNGTLQNPISAPTGASPAFVTAADLDADTRLDLITASAASSNVSVLLGHGDGTFASAVNFAAGTAPLGVAVGDFNGDGLPDMAVADWMGNTVSVLLNTSK